MNVTLKLSVYTWPALQGINTETRESIHATLASAQNAMKLESETAPYSYAVLYDVTDPTRPPIPRRITDGTICDHRDPDHYVRGELYNTEHPSLVKLRADWQFMIDTLIPKIGQRPLVSEAGTLLRERHHDVSGFAEKLAFAAIDRADRA